MDGSSFSGNQQPRKRNYENSNNKADQTKLVTPLVAGLHGNSHAFGKTAAGWIEVYERWAFGELAVPIDENGNAVVDRHVVLMPIPNTPGDGTPGHIDVTLDAGQAFVLPLWAFLGTDYTDGTPPDPLLDVIFFNPPIPIIGFPPVNSIIWFQGIGIVYHPLSVGTHTLQLDAVNTQPAFGGFFEYHNTWTVTVEPRR